MEATVEHPKSELTQMNTRIDRKLKERGDAALARAGFTPSQAVRALWKFAAEHEPKEIEALLRGEEGPDEAESQDAASKLQEIEAFWAKCDEIVDGLQNRRVVAGFSPLDDSNSLSDDELKEREWLERLEEREIA